MLLMCAGFNREDFARETFASAFRRVGANVFFEAGGPYP
jgi:hypothetical protein